MSALTILFWQCRVLASFFFFAIYALNLHGVLVSGQLKNRFTVSFKQNNNNGRLCRVCPQDTKVNFEVEL